MYAPITLFVFNRPAHTHQTVEALKKNALSKDSDLIVYSDAAKSESQAEAVNEVRHYVRQIDGFKSVTVVERETNFGLARSIIDGVTATVSKYGRIIVLEDDMVTSPYFLTYMNEALEKFADDDRVVSIHGYVYPVAQPLPEAFFLPGADCWGWATWSRGWACLNGDGQFLLDELKRRKLIRAFDFNGAYPFSKMLEGQIKGANDSWAVRWYASAFLAGKLTLYPGRSLVHNIGNDNSGTHCGESASLDAELSKTPISLHAIKVEPSQAGRQAFEKFFRQEQTGSLRRLTRKTSALLRVQMNALRALARDWLPPAVVRLIRRRQGPQQDGGLRFEGNFATWEEASAHCTGYDAEDILAKVLAATLKVKRGEAAFERDSVLFDEIEYAWPVLAGLMWAAARNGGKLNVLDFGGALGSCYFQNRKFLQTLPEVRWNVVEQAHYVDAGRAHIQDEQLRFYTTIEECLTENQLNVILLSSVLQYLESPIELIGKLNKVGASCLIVDRTPFSIHKEDKLLVQEVPTTIYSASYPMWVFSLSKFKQLLERNWCLVASNLSPEGYVQTTNGVEFSFQGMLLESRR